MGFDGLERVEVGERSAGVGDAVGLRPRPPFGAALAESVLRDAVPAPGGGEGVVVAHALRLPDRAPTAAQMRPERGGDVVGECRVGASPAPPVHDEVVVVGIAC